MNTTVSNLDRWRLYNRDLFSPAHFVDWGWYSIVAAALERRVWYDNESNPLFPCMYVVLIGPAGVGKGLVLDKCAEFMRMPKEIDPTPIPAGSNIQNTIKRLNQERAKEADALFNIGADSTTFESLLLDTKDATESFVNPYSGETTVQCAVYFLLDEYTSIFKKDSEDLSTFLLTAWNGKLYQRKTKNKGHDRLVNPCFNMLGNTTPTEFSKILHKGIIGTGLLRRTILVYGDKNRYRGIRLPAPDIEQQAAKAHLVKWIRHLKGLCPRVVYTNEAFEYMDRWWKREDMVYINKNQKLEEYYQSKQTHVHKITMAMHFTDEGYERPVEVETIKRAIAFLDANERDMHLAMSAGGRNELSPIADQTLIFIRKNHGGVTINKLLEQFIPDVDYRELTEIIASLLAQGKITLNQEFGLYIAIK